MLGRILSSWNPNRYNSLRELSIGRIVALLLVSAAASSIIFWLLLFPSIFQANQALESLGETTNITFSASMQQTQPTYLLRNPDVLFTTGEGNAFITITPQGVSIKKFVFFGKETYSWKGFGSLSTVPAELLLKPLTIFLLPSVLVWTAAFLLVVALAFVLLFTLIAYFVVHAQKYKITYSELWKVGLYASIPSFSLFAVTPILRLGLPVGVLLGLCFIAWLIYSILGTALFSEKNAPRSGHRDKPSKG